MNNWDMVLAASSRCGRFQNGYGLIEPTSLSTVR